MIDGFILLGKWVSGSMLAAIFIYVAFRMASAGWHRSKLEYQRRIQEEQEHVKKGNGRAVGSADRTKL